MRENSLKNKIKFPEITVTFVHLACHMMPGRLVFKYPVQEGKNQLRAQVSGYSQLPGFSSSLWILSSALRLFSLLC